MTDKDRIDAFMKLADFRLTRWKSRSDTEWKMSLAFWGLLVAATIKLGAVDLGWWIPTIVAFGYIILWVAPIWVRNLEDQRKAVRYTAQAEEILTGRPVERQAIHYGVQFAAIFQTITTIALVFYTWWAISTKSTVR